jgi:endonuclease YncB( thermonuclease family)
MSFARWIVDVWLPDGRSYADMLLEAGHAVPMTR